jgi:hypothetical protein
VPLLRAAVSGAAAGNGIFAAGDRRPKTCLRDKAYAQRHKSRPHRSRKTGRKWAFPQAGLPRRVSVDWMVVESVICEPGSALTTGINRANSRIRRPFVNASGQINPVSQAFLLDIPVQRAREFFNGRREFLWA